MGYNNPDLRTQLDIYGTRAQDVPAAPRNALVNQGLIQQNALRGKQLGNYDQDRANELTRQGVMDKRTSFFFLQKAAPTITPQTYYQTRETFVNQMGVDPSWMPDQAMVQAEAAKEGMSEEEAIVEWQKNFMPQEKAVAGAGLSSKSTQEIDEKDESGRWMTLKQRYNPATGKFETYSRGPKYKTSADERRIEKNLEAFDKIDAMDPMEAYSQGWRMEDNGDVYRDAATGAPEKLKPFTNTLGKRANMKVIKQVGDHVDDSIEVYIGLQNPKVQADLKRAKNEGMWDQAAGRWSNAVKAWMMRNGISADTKTFKTIMHMQRMASEQRKTMLGTAVTQTELQSILAWMPNAGDSYETMLSKISLAAEEGYEEFKRWMDINKDTSNMAPFYKAWGLNRFDMPEKNIKALARSGMAEGDALPPQTPIQKRGDELEAQGMSEAEIIRTLQKEFPRRADNKR